MRFFSSYGPIDKEINYFVPRREILAKACTYLTGEIPSRGGHYITVWAPRQTGKSSLLRDASQKIIAENDYYVANIDIQNLQDTDNNLKCMNTIIKKINNITGLHLPLIKEIDDFETVFSKKYLNKPLILIIDEFDALKENVINNIVAAMRNIYNTRKKETVPSAEMHFLLHGVALIGVRSVVGVDNKSGSPFNIQKSLFIDNLSEAEVREMYHWYQKESGQKVEPEVINRIYYVTRGHPGLVSWFGELLTRDYNRQPHQPLSMPSWTTVYARALHILPNNYIINIISKVMAEKYRTMVLNLFRTGHKKIFEFEDPQISWLYMHGVVSYEEVGDKYYVRFSCQFVQEKIFRRFSAELVETNGELLADAFTDLTPVINEQELNIPGLLSLYQDYYTKNRTELVRYAQRRIDMRIMEVVYHFQLYSWLDSFFSRIKARVLPEFPTGNGKIDLLIHYAGKCYGLELKSFRDLSELDSSIRQASVYGQSLSLDIITLVVFTEHPLPAEIKVRYDALFKFAGSAHVRVFFVMTG